jgi:hypothetical protein
VNGDRSAVVGGRAGFRRTALACGGVAAVMVVVAFCVAAGISRAYWGYWLFRPPVLREVRDLAKVTAVVPVKAAAGESASRALIADDEFVLGQAVGIGRADPYYCLEERLLIAVEDRGLLPRQPSADLGALPELFPLIRQTGILAKPDRGYEDADQLRGVVVDGVSQKGKRLVFVGVVGQQLSNDHYPYYELLFAGEPGAVNLRFVRGQRFFFDVAGIEGLEWYGIWPVLALIGILIGFAVVTVMMAVRSVSSRRRAQALAPLPEFESGGTRVGVANRDELYMWMEEKESD